MKSTLGFAALVAGAMLIFASAVLIGLVPSDAVISSASVAAGLVLGPFLVCYMLATLNDGGKLTPLLSALGISVAGTTLVLSNFQAELVLGKNVGEAMMTISRVLLFVGVFLTGVISVTKGANNEKNKEYWQRRNVPFVLSFVQVGFVLIMPLISFWLFESLKVSPTGLALLEDIFGQAAVYGMMIFIATAGMAGAALLAIPVLIRLYYKPWFVMGRAFNEARTMNMAWIIYTVFVAGVILFTSYLVAQQTGMMLYVQQVGTNEVPFYAGLCMTALAVSFTSMLALWRVENYVLLP